MNDNIKKLKENREKSCIKIFEKYDQIEKNVLMKSMEKKRNNQMMIEQLDKKRKITYENRRKLSELKQQKIDENEKKKEKQNEKYIEKKKNKEEENMIKKEEERIKNIEKANLIMRKNRIAEYKNQLKMDELEEK